MLLRQGTKGVRFHLNTSLFKYSTYFQQQKILTRYNDSFSLGKLFFRVEADFGDRQSTKTVTVRQNDVSVIDAPYDRPVAVVLGYKSKDSDLTRL